MRNRIGINEQRLTCDYCGKKETPCVNVAGTQKSCSDCTRRDRPALFRLYFSDYNGDFDAV